MGSIPAECKKFCSILQTACFGRFFSFAVWLFLMELRFTDFLRSTIGSLCSYVEIGPAPVIFCKVRNVVFLDLVHMLKLDEQFSFLQLLDIWAVEYSETNFTVNYRLLSNKAKVALWLQVNLDDSRNINSLVDLFPSAGWLEREVWEGFGIFFSGNPDLRRLLLDYGFEGNPLRKYFPVVGYTEIRYDHALKKIVTEPVVLSQEYRLFTFQQPWNT